MPNLLPDFNVYTLASTTVYTICIKLYTLYIMYCEHPGAAFITQHSL